MDKKFLNKIIIPVVFIVIIILIIILNFPKKSQLTGELRIYTSMPVEVINKIQKEFKKKYSGIELSVIPLGTNELIERVSEEMSGNSIQADLIWAIDFTTVEELKNSGALLKYKSPQSTEIISFLKDENDYYCAANLFSVVIAYNTDNIKVKPTSYRNLLNSEYHGKIGLVDPNFSQTTLDALENLVQSEKFGWDYFIRLYGNNAQVADGDLALDQLITSGDLSLGLTIDFVIRGLKDKNPNLPIDYVFPDDEISIVSCPIAITKDCNNLSAAQAFVDFILSQEGQNILVSQGITPVRQDITPPPKVPAISQEKIVPLNVDKILIQEDELQSIFKEIFSGKQTKVDTKYTATLYCSLPETIADQLGYEFEIQNPGTYLKIFHGRTNEIIDKINQEIYQGLIRADLLWIDDFTFFEELKKKGVLLYFNPPEADGVLDALKDKEGYYNSGRLLTMVIAYNTDKVTTAPGSYRDLLDVKYQGRVGYDEPETCSSFLYFTGTLLQNKNFGEEFFINLKENLPQIQTCTQTAEKIANGDLDIGITQGFTVRRLLKENPALPLDCIFPKEGLVLVPCPIAIIKNTPHPQAAMSFVRYVLSKEGQTLLRDIGGFIPVRLDVNPPDDIPSIVRLKVIPSNKKWIEENKDYIISKFAEFFNLAEK